MNKSQTIETLITTLTTPQKVFDLFEFLNYPVLDPSYTRKKESLIPNVEVAKNVHKIYQVALIEDQLPILLIETTQSRRSFIRELIHRLSSNYQYFMAVITADWREYQFVIPEKERVAAGEIKLKITRLVLNREMPYRTDLETLQNLRHTEDHQTYRDIWLCWKKAFSLERVTGQFFEDYKRVFFTIREIVHKQRIHIRQAHEFTQQLLNRLMFNYFIAKKRWMGDNPRFLAWFWEEYKRQRRHDRVEADSFYDKWLRVLFLEAFNNRFNPRQHFTAEINGILQLAPYLNGGLFKENELDRNLDVQLSDALFKDIFQFLNKYNFTIREDLPLDVEVAVDPEMLGYVYESLANVAEEIYQRQDLGIFYTPRIEVDFMCRRTLVEYLHKQIPGTEKDIWYHLLFDDEPTTAEKYLSKENLWNDLEAALENLKIVDPACGSGAFLVGLLLVLAQLYHLVNKHLGREIDDFNLKKRIINNSLYGVDVMPWAVHSAELRLWLQLIVESELEISDLRSNPLLPNLNFKLRVGDSLVQEVGGLNLRFRGKEISEGIKRRLRSLAVEKEKFYNNDPSGKFKTDRALLEEELRVYRDMLRERIIYLRKKWDTQGTQASFLQEEDMDSATVAEHKQRARAEIEQLKQMLHKLNDPAHKPFVWDIDFSEIFGEKKGFDIVIGNPPYVRQEKIAPPNRAANEVSPEEKREYKDKLQKSVQLIYPFQKRLDGRSDYYIYFYFHGLDLLNANGTFCFITSNSWLDVGYGRDLQEFLLKYAPILAIYDNQAKRSFKHADVNTIIALFAAPQIPSKQNSHSLRDLSALRHTAKFVAFKKPFQEVLNTSNLLVMEKADQLVKRDDFRVFPIKQEELLREGWEFPEGETDSQSSKKFSAGKYVGNKWGGKYLRAPEIFFTILEKGKDKLIRLGDIADIRRGFTTGANEFFYVEDVTDKNPDLNRVQNLRNLKTIEDIKKAGLRVVKPSKIRSGHRDLKLFLIESEYLKPVLKSSKEVNSVFTSGQQLKYRIVICNEDKKVLQKEKPYILDYIGWGEKWAFDKRPTTKNRKNWWDVGKWEIPQGILPCGFGDIFRFFINDGKIFSDKRMYFLDDTPEDIINFMNSSIYPMFLELGSRVGLGDGLLDLTVYEFKSTLVIKGIKLPNLRKRRILSVFDELGFNRDTPIREQEPNPLPDRRALDDIIFDELGLTEQERKEVYWAVAELVKNRLDKARSV